MILNKDLRETMNDIQLIATKDYLDNSRKLDNQGHYLKSRIIVINDDVKLNVIDRYIINPDNATNRYIEPRKPCREIRVMVKDIEIIKLIHSYRKPIRSVFEDRKLKLQYLNKMTNSPLYKIGYVSSLKVTQNSDLTNDAKLAIQIKALNDRLEILSLMKQYNISGSDKVKTLNKKR